MAEQNYVSVCMSARARGRLLEYYDRIIRNWPVPWEEGEGAGYARLVPGLPGCFPFVLERPAETLMGALASIEGCLLPEKTLLKITTSDREVAEACRAAGFELAYELVKMLRRADAIGP